MQYVLNTNMMAHHHHVGVSVTSDNFHALYELSRAWKHRWQTVVSGRSSMHARSANAESGQKSPGWNISLLHWVLGASRLLHFSGLIWFGTQDTRAAEVEANCQFLVCHLRLLEYPLNRKLWVMKPLQWGPAGKYPGLLRRWFQIRLHRSDLSEARN